MANSYPYLNRDRQFEIAIIGGGVVGAICAWHLCKAGYEVALVTKGRVGDGATGASLGTVCANPGEGMHILARMYGMDTALEAYRAEQEAVGSIAALLRDREEEAEYSKERQLVFAQDPSDAVILYRNFKALSKAGFSVEWADRSLGGGLYPFAMEGGILSGANSALMDPLWLTHMLLREAQQMGLTVYENTTAERICRQTEGVAVKTDHFHTLRAGRVIMATGVPPASLRPHVMRWRCQTLCTLPLPPVQGMTSDLLLGDYDGEWRMRMTRERLLVSRIGVPWPQWDRTKRLEAQRILRKISHLYPKTEGILTSAYFFMADEYQTADSLPLIGPMADAPNVYTVSAYHGNGIGAGMIAGRLLCAWLRGDRPPLGKLYRPERILPAKQGDS